MKTLFFAAFSLALAVSAGQAQAHYYNVPSRPYDEPTYSQGCGQSCGQRGYPQYDNVRPAPPPPPRPGPRVAACGMTFRISGADIAIVSSATGTGLITCTSLDGRVVAEADVDIDVLGIGVGLGVYEFAGAVGNLGILDPADIAGSYFVLDANAALGIAAGANFGLKAQASGLSFAGTVEGGVGIGAGLFGKEWRISLPRPCRYYY